MNSKRPPFADRIDSLGDFIAGQRRSAELSLRQLAAKAGVSNPYLSQIERGLRKPSAEVMQQLAKALRVSAETLYVRAGILDESDLRTVDVETAVRADPALNDRQKRVLLDVYASFVKENVQAEEEDEGASRPARARRPAANPSTNKINEPKEK
jgi:transcriptional regulator with XRE-family HTH domain